MPPPAWRSDVLEQDLDRDGHPPEVRHAVERREAVDVGEAGAEAGSGAERIAGRHGGPRWLGAAGGPPMALRCRPKSSVESDDAILAPRAGAAAAGRPGHDGGAPAPPGRRGRRPLPPGAHRHGDEVHWEAHTHPHVGPADDGRPVIGIVGAGAVGTALGVALSRAGWQVGAVASRDAGRRERFRALVPGSRAFPEAAAILDECHLAVLAVPDDALADLAADAAPVLRPGRRPHERPARGGRAGAGARRRDERGLVPPARRLRRPRPCAGGPARRDRRDRGRRRHPRPARRDGHLDRGRPGAPGARLEGGLPRGRRPRRRRADRAPRRARRGRGPDRPRRGRGAGHLRPAGGAGAGQRRGPGDRPGADRSGRPRRRRDDRGPPRRRRGRRRRGARRLPRLGLRQVTIAESRRGLAPEAAARLRDAFTRSR